MTQEERNLVLIDLCGRLPYDIVIKDEYGDYINVNLHNANIEHLIDRVVSGLDKMMLRPMSSMTEEEEKVFGSFIFTEHHGWDGKTDYHEYVCIDNINKFYDWLNRKMFDYRGLIPKGLAKIAPEGTYLND